jgi:4-amino-4-deoxy-L-arabinose transferase-like glycosyltransferase
MRIVSGIAKGRALGGVLALTLISVFSRLPQLRSPNLLVDGDEAVLGLMAKHLAQGRELPVFFYGQHYALSTVEAAAGALAFALFGVGPVTLKLAMLALWTIGVLFLFLGLSRRVGLTRGFWIAAILIVNPVWAAWSMKGGGGYLTAFAATGVLLWLLADDQERDSVWRWVIAGALTGLIFLAQPLWLPGVLPAVLVVLVLRRRLLWGLSYLAVTVAVILIVKLATPATTDAWAGPPVGNPNFLGSLPGIARQIYVFLTGSYYLSWAIDPPGPMTRVLAIVWCGVCLAAVPVQLFRLVTRRYCFLSHLLFVSIIATLVVEGALLSARDARYLLPLGPLLVALAGVELVDLVDRHLLPRRAAFLSAATLLLLGSLSMREFREFNYLWTNPPNRWTEARRLQQVFGYLKVKDVTRVFSMNGMLDSQIVFYSDERVLSRWANPIGRYPPYVTAVDRALASGEPVAVVGYTHGSGAPGCSDVPICTGGLEGLVANPEAMFTVDGKYFVYVGADRGLLEKLGFRIWD